MSFLYFVRLFQNRERGKENISQVTCSYGSQLITKDLKCINWKKKISYSRLMGPSNAQKRSTFLYHNRNIKKIPFMVQSYNSLTYESCYFLLFLLFFVWFCLTWAQIRRVSHLFQSSFFLYILFSKQQNFKFKFSQAYEEQRLLLNFASKIDTPK